MLKFLPLSFFPHTTVYPVSDPKMAFLDPMDPGFDDDDDLSTAIDTETLTANDLIPEEFAEARINRSHRSKGLEGVPSS